MRSVTRFVDAPFLRGAVKFAPVFDSLYARSSYRGASMGQHGKLPIWMLLILIGLAGIIAIVLPDFLPPFPFMETVRAIGAALFTAFVLGFTIDAWMKREIRRDVFFATLGYILPDEFREQIRRVVEHKFIADDHFMHVEIQTIDAERVRVTTSIESVVTNITANPESQRAVVHMDEWGFPGEPSTVEECTMSLPDGTVIEGTDRKEANCRLLVSSETRSIEPRGTAKLLRKFSEVRRINDMAIFEFLTPIRNPRIQLKVPDDIVCDCGFGSKDPVESSHFVRMHTLKGMYFPGAFMRLRWYPKAPNS